jgi:hypothetical protein
MGGCGVCFVDVVKPKKAFATENTEVSEEKQEDTTNNLIPVE